jgi:hypothetical protein
VLSEVISSHRDTLLPRCLCLQDGIERAALLTSFSSYKPDPGRGDARDYENSLRVASTFTDPCFTPVIRGASIYTTMMSSPDGSAPIHSFMRAADNATKCREAADFDTPAPAGAGT